MLLLRPMRIDLSASRLLTNAGPTGTCSGGFRRVLRVNGPLFAALACAAVGCSDDPTIVKARCPDDQSCGPGFVCESGECVPAEAVSCAQVDGGQAILQPSPIRVDFGVTGSGSSQQTIRLQNIGTCTVTLFEARWAAGDNSPFACPTCQADRFPIELFPFREIDLEVFFTPDGVGEFGDALVLVSDDSEFTEIRVPVRATFNGIPAVAAAPTAVDFDFAPVGRTVSRTVEIRNRGTGTAALEIRRVAIETATVSAFSVTSALDGADAPPVMLAPVTADVEDRFVVNLRYHPQEVEAHTADLVLYTNQPDPGVVRIPLTGSSQTPAQISVSPAQIDFGAVPIGQSTAQPLTIVNEGGHAPAGAFSMGRHRLHDRLRGSAPSRPRRRNRTVHDSTSPRNGHGAKTDSRPPDLGNQRPDATDGDRSSLCAGPGGPGRAGRQNRHELRKRCGQCV